MISLPKLPTIWMITPKQRLLESIVPGCWPANQQSGWFAVFLGDELLPIYIWDYKKALLRVPINQPGIMECNNIFGNHHPSETLPFAGHNFEFRFKAICAMYIPVYLVLQSQPFFLARFHLDDEPNDYLKKNACFTISIHLKTWVVQSSRW